MWAGGGTRRSLTTLFPELGTVVRQRGNGVSWDDQGTSSCLKHVAFLDVVHDRGTQMVLRGDARLRRQRLLQ